MLALRSTTKSSQLVRIFRYPPRLAPSRLLSSSETVGSSAVIAASESKATASTSSMLEGTDTASLGNVIRHGHGDRVITLNVGGKEYLTLRSTVNANAVLADHVARAEANREITKAGAVFIDRDPKHFDVILLHLRNRVEQLPTAGSTSTAKSWMALSNLNLPAKAPTHRLPLPGARKSSCHHPTAASRSPWATPTSSSMTSSSWGRVDTDASRRSVNTCSTPST